MNLRRTAWQLPLRLAAGSYLVNSGLSKWGADDVTAKHVQGFASGAYPLLAKLDARLFSRHCPQVRSPSEAHCCCRSCLPASPGWP